MDLVRLSLSLWNHREFYFSPQDRKIVDGMRRQLVKNGIDTGMYDNYVILREMGAGHRRASKIAVNYKEFQVPIHFRG